MRVGRSGLSGVSWGSAAAWLVGAVLACAGVFLFMHFAAGPELTSEDEDRSYQIVRVVQDVTVEPDGSLEVTEARTFDFDGAFNGVYWKLPEGYNKNNGHDVSVEVQSAQVAPSATSAAADKNGGSAYSLQEGSSSDGGYTIEDSTNDSGAPIKLVTLYQRAADSKLTFTLSYRITGVVTRWQDTAELYWKYVSDGWDAASQNVTCTIHLPQAAGTPAAWGHGPLDGNVKIDGTTVTFFSPVVGGADFAEARILFDNAAVPQAPAPAASISNPADKSAQVKAQEQAWADQANQKRKTAQQALAFLAALGVVVGAAALVVVRRTRARWLKTHTPAFTDTYFRDVPTEAEVPVLSTLYSENSLDPQHFTAELMDLSHRHVVELSLVPNADDPHAKGTWVLTKLSDGSTKIEELALALAFQNARTDAEGRRSVELKAMGKGTRESEARAFDEWKAELDAQVQSKFGDSGRERATVRTTAVIVGILALFASGVAGHMSAGASDALTSPLIVAVLLGWLFALVVGLFYALAQAGALHDLNQTGIDTLAKLQALRRWLLEFTRLDEAIPQDLALWDRLLVMAVALGVSQQVIKQLKVVFPEAFAENNENFYPYFHSYLWLNSYHGSAPLNSVNAASRHYVASAAAVAASSSSSGGGFGGGFSGGGGGGFGGGGGGGAF